MRISDWSSDVCSSDLAEEKLLVVARLLATGAEVLLFDEPLSGLDPTTLQEIFPIFRRLAENGKTVCIIEHNLAVIKTLCDVAVFLDEGTTIAIGTPDDLTRDTELAQRSFGCTRSEERRVGKVGVSTGHTRCAPATH